MKLKGTLFLILCLNLTSLPLLANSCRSFFLPKGTELSLVDATPASAYELILSELKSLSENPVSFVSKRSKGNDDIFFYDVRDLEEQIFAEYIKKKNDDGSAFKFKTFRAYAKMKYTNLLLSGDKDLKKVLARSGVEILGQETFNQAWDGLREKSQVQLESQTSTLPPVNSLLLNLRLEKTGSRLNQGLSK